MTAYELLAELAERELDLVRAGAFDGLAAIAVRRRALVAGLPATPPSDAQPALLAAAALQAQLIDALTGATRAARVELAQRHSGRGVVRAYGQLGAAAPARAGHLV